VAACAKWYLAKKMEIESIARKKESESNENKITAQKPVINEEEKVKYVSGVKYSSASILFGYSVLSKKSSIPGSLMKKSREINI
jgi:hypothetical protein